MTFDAVRRLAHDLPDVEDGTSYGTPALKVKGKLFVRLRPDLDAIVVKMPFDKRDELVRTDPGVYFLTDHYVPYEWVLVRLGAVKTTALRAILKIGWQATQVGGRRPRRG